MPDPDSPQVSALYRLRVVVAGVSPLIWRRLLVPGKTTIAGLHTVVQAAHPNERCFSQLVQRSSDICAAELGHRQGSR